MWSAALNTASATPSFQGDREISESYTRYAKPGTVPPAMFSNRNPITRAYYDPPAGLCEGLGTLQGGTIGRVAAPAAASTGQKRRLLQHLHDPDAEGVRATPIWA